MPKEKRERKRKVQGAWISNEDKILLKKEAQKQGTTPTGLASIVLGEYCDRKRLEEAENLVGSMKRRERDGDKGIGDQEAEA